MGDISEHIPTYYVPDWRARLEKAEAVGDMNAANCAALNLIADIVSRGDGIGDESLEQLIERVRRMRHRLSRIEATVLR